MESSRHGGSDESALAGIVSRIRLENFMCHSSLHIEFGDHVNFVTGQNGSGKSAILTALCVAFGCRAKGTQRASTLKDFIKTGCSYANIAVELKNGGQDAFKPEKYGDLIIIERRITQSTGSTVLKNSRGIKIAHRKDELQELIEHFNIDVENPCVIMSQDKSREFLHSGNDKEKFKFFFKATLLQQVSELLQNIRSQLDAANAMVVELESTIRPVQKELNELLMKIKSMEHVEEMTQQVQKLKKKLAWAWVYEVDQQMQEETAKLEILKGRIPTCQARIERQQVKVDELKKLLSDKKTQIASLMEKTSEVRRMKEELQQNLSLATRQRIELQEECTRKTKDIQKMADRVGWLEHQIKDIQDQHVKNTQAEESELEELLKALQEKIDTTNSNLNRLREQENFLSDKLTIASNAIKEISREVDIYEAKHRSILSDIRVLERQRTNKVTAFGGDRVLGLLRAIERHHQKFRSPPIGPIGAHVGSAERQVLVKDYEAGKVVAFEQRISNLKEVYTSDGFRMFYRGSVQTTLPPNKNIRSGRLCSSIDDQVTHLENEATNAVEMVRQSKRRKRELEENLNEIEDKLRILKAFQHFISQRQCLNEDRNLRANQLKLCDTKSSYAAEANSDSAPNVDELYHEISKVQDEIQEKEMLMETLHLRMADAEAKAKDLKSSYEDLCDSAKADFDVFEGAERELLSIEENLRQAEAEKAHYETVMERKVLRDITEAEALFKELELKRQENSKKASIICPENEVEALGGCAGITPEQFTMQLNKLKQRLQQESRRYDESIDDLRLVYEKKERKIARKQQTYAAFREKINACQESLDLRWSKFQRNATYLKRELTWKYALLFQ
ncbi:hypothetical protein QJS04_geneDACA012444 [Acorus gramineus]|uniref:Rad50/SbcC-type AAA domain-containing protein n=1 Tax=Acorus gramineus TaxID=55184 RepID=A0AAV9B7B1_ACOGR|nr:hypothetical protein QJS04_geneDACA012444 [Acorus gramineus]